MITIPNIEYSFLGVLWHLSSLDERRLCVASVPSSIYVEWLKSKVSPWFAIYFGAYNHAVTPSHCFTHWDLF